MVPPLSRQAMERGNVDGGHSVPLIFKHKSGLLSFGDAVIHKGEVAWWYPGDMADVCHVPESKDSNDPIVEWMLFPKIENIVGILEVMGALTIQLDSFIKAFPNMHPCREQTEFVNQSRAVLNQLVDDGVLHEEERV